jgi:REP element-mobilizing transposase RayT
MTRPRKELISISDTSYDHVVSRCVRRTFLCGFDQQTQQDYEHRRQWIEDRIRLLSSLFVIDICAYAVMSNHYHIVVKLTPQQSVEWSHQEVITRWTSLFEGQLLIQRQRRLPLINRHLS